MACERASGGLILSIGVAVLVGCGSGGAAHDAASSTGGAAGAAGAPTSDAGDARDGAAGAAGGSGGGDAAQGTPDAPVDQTGAAADAGDAISASDAADGATGADADTDAGPQLRQPTFPGVVASPVFDSLQVADFYLASDEKTIATTYNPVRLDDLCDTAPINLLHDGGQGFQLVREAVGYSHWHASAFSDDGAFIAATDGAGTGCTQPDSFVSMRSDGSGKASRLALTSGARQELLGIFGTTALNLDWRPPGSTINPDAYVLRDLARAGGPLPLSYGVMRPVPDPTGKVTVWGSSAGVVLSPIDKSNPVALAPGSSSCRHVWSADGKTLAFRWGSGDCFSNEATLSLIDRDGTHLRDAGAMTLANPPPAFSPDGQTLAWSATGAGGQRTIVVRGIAGQAPVTVIAPAVASEQSWSTDSRIWFSPSGKWLIVEVESSSYLVAATGGTFKNAGAVYGTFSPDETLFASRMFPTGTTSYVVTTTDAAAPRVLSSKSAFAPVVATAPGVRRMVFSDNWDSIKHETDLVLGDLDGGNRQVVARLTGFGDYLKGPFLPRARRWTSAQWFGDIFIYAGPIQPYPDQPFDLLAVSADGKTKGVLAPDVLLFGWVDRNPTSLFFVRRMPNNDHRLWRVTLP